MNTRVEWTRKSLRELTIWIAGYIRDDIDLRANRTMHLEVIQTALIETNGNPPDSYSATIGPANYVIWEYVGQSLYFIFQREKRPVTLWRRQTGRGEEVALIVTAIRRPLTPQELLALQG
jgi:hypothetical protein